MTDISELVSARYAEHTRVIEQACEAALQRGTCGVRVEWDVHNTIATVDPDVPYGHIHEYPLGRFGADVRLDL